MMRKLTMLLVVLTSLVFTWTSALAQVQTNNSIFDVNFQVPDRTKEAAKLLARAQALRSYYADLRAGRIPSDTSLLQALKGVKLPPKATELQKRYYLELKLAEAPFNSRAWSAAAAALLREKRLNEAGITAAQAYRLADTPNSRAHALDILAQVSLLVNEPINAANFYRKALDEENTRQRRRSLRRIVDRFVLRITNIRIDTNKAHPSACLVFSRQLANPLPIKPQDYIKFEKPIDVNITASGRQICVTGLEFGKHYKVTALAGIPGRDGGQLYADNSKTLVIPNRTPRLTFGTGTYVLPQVGDTTVPIKSVNMDVAYLSLYLVRDRGLVPFLREHLFERRLNQYEKQRLTHEVGVKVWQGSVDLKKKLNEEITTLIPVRDILKDKQPGAYALVAEPSQKKRGRNWFKQATQWFIVSDIALTSLSGPNGMDVFIRSLASAEALPDVTLKLVAKDNRVLAELKSDKTGKSHFPAATLRGKGGDKPAALIAETKDGDYAFLRLTGPALDLSDRGAKGRSVDGTLDAYLFSERGIYRPGETVHLTGLVRDRQAKAIARTPAIIKVRRPDGVLALERPIKSDAFGGFHLPFSLSAGARTGYWTVNIIVGEDKNIIGRTRFQVEDFVPDRIAVTAKTDTVYLERGKPHNLLIQADYLYGVPAGDLTGRARLTFRRDPAPHKGYEAYKFGLLSDLYRPEAPKSLSFRTDQFGAARIAYRPKQLPDTTHPLRAHVDVEVRDVNGRPVFTKISGPVRLRDFDIGIKTTNPNGIGEDEDARLDLIALGNGSIPAANKVLTARWIKEHHSYNWYRDRNRWRYRTTISDEPVASEKITTDQKGQQTLIRRLSPGRYRLVVTSADETIASSLRFSVGWWSAAQSLDTPDALTVTLQETSVATGDTLSGHIKAPFTGKALINVVSDRLLHSQEMEIAKDGTKFNIPVQPGWGPGAYVLVNAFRPNAGAQSRLPIRAMGMAWFTVDKSQTDLKLTMTLPDKITPRQTIKVPIQIEGAVAGPMKVVLAAVDEGVLRLTKYKSPNPGEHYFAKQAFGLDARDYYGRLIRTEAGTRGKVRTGAGAHATARRGDNAQGITRRSTKVVAIYQKAVLLDATGKGELSLSIPDFNGSLRLMAIAYGTSQVAAGASNVIVRRPIIAELLLPRFLSPGDEAQATLSLQNLTGKELSAEISLKDEKNLINFSKAAFGADLKDKERLDLPVTIIAKDLGTAKLYLTVKSKGHTDITRNWDLQIRPAWPIVSEQNVSVLEPGKKQTVDLDPSGTYYAGSYRQDLQLLAGPNLDPKRLSVELHDYRYLCTEQTVSKAFPALLRGQLSKIYGIENAKDKADLSVERALVRLSDRQNSSGGFGVWRAYGSSNVWLNVHVTDFLIRAKEAGHFVSNAMLDLSVKNLQRLVQNRRPERLEAKAYAHYVLARLGQGNASAIRYFSDQNKGKLRTGLGNAHLAAALHLIGEKELAKSMFLDAIKISRSLGTGLFDYGSDLRDRAAVISLLAETQADPQLLAELTGQVEALFEDKQYFNTQEMAWMLRAAVRLAPADIKQLEVKIDGTRQKFSSLSMDLSQLSSPQILLTNTSPETLRSIRTRRGVKKSAPAASAFGFDIKRTAFDLTGKPVKLQDIKQHSRYIILIEGTALNNLHHEALIVDLLPAGLEIENARLNSRAARNRFPFLPRLSRVDFMDARDDRFVAAVQLIRKRQKFAVAYQVRAVTPGQFIRPGVFIEDMYRPKYRAIGQIDLLKISK